MDMGNKILIMNDDKELCELLVTWGNREMLRRALENVVRNAVHYTAQGGTVEVRLEREAAV